MEITGKNILLTGASSGIGLYLAKALSKEKCNIALLARRKNTIDELASQLKGTGSNLLSIKCDVSNKDEVQSAVSEAKDKFGAIDIAILNSGISTRTSVENFSSKNAEDIFNVNVLGIVYCIEALMPHLIKNKNGMLVGVSSLAEGRGFPKSGFYCASKAAASLILESIRIELKRYNVKVLTVKPGFVKTPMTDKNNFRMPFLMDVEKAVDIIIKGIKKEKRIIQFPLPTVIGAKLLRILPDPVFDFIAKGT